MYVLVFVLVFGPRSVRAVGPVLQAPFCDMSLLLESAHMMEASLALSSPPFYCSSRLSFTQVPPFASLLDWAQFSIALHPRDALTLPVLLDAIPESTRVRMARHVAFVYDQFFSSKQRIAAVALALIRRNIARAREFAIESEIVDCAPGAPRRVWPVGA